MGACSSKSGTKSVKGNKSEQSVDGSEQSDDQQGSSRINEIRQLSRCGDSVDIDEYEDIESYRQQIAEFQKEESDFKIKISFYWIDELDQKMEIMQMIDSFGCNDKVSEVDIRLHNSVGLSAQLIENIGLRFINVSQIDLLDQNNHIDWEIHNQIRTMLQSLTLTNFRLVFNHGTLKSDQNGIEIIKYYNQVMNEKRYLTHLYYEHDKLKKSGSSRNGVKSLIKATNQL